uniref:Deoxyhypusine synthase n=1 Tax=Pavo cristatus TaxID=9049 RepID=A0A8C9FP99_PAVCR
MIFFHSYKHPGLVLDIVEDLRLINTRAIFARKTGMIILGGGLVKHHIANANLMRNGADFSVYVNTAQEFDGSDSGAQPDEAVSWGKIRMDATPVKVGGRWGGAGVRVRTRFSTARRAAAGASPAGGSSAGPPPPRLTPSGFRRPTASGWRCHPWPHPTPARGRGGASGSPSSALWSRWSLKGWGGVRLNLRGGQTAPLGGVRMGDSGHLSSPDTMMVASSLNCTQLTFCRRHAGWVLWVEFHGGGVPSHCNPPPPQPPPPRSPPRARGTCGPLARWPRPTAPRPYRSHRSRSGCYQKSCGGHRDPRQAPGWLREGRGGGPVPPPLPGGVQHLVAVALVAAQRCALVRVPQLQGLVAAARQAVIAVHCVWAPREGPCEGWGGRPRPPAAPPGWERGPPSRSQPRFRSHR